MSLNNRQVEFFRHSGFFKIDQAIPDDFVFKLRAVLDRELAGELPPFSKDDNGIIHRLSAIYDRDPVFKEVVRSNWVLDPLESLLGPNIEFSRNRHNHATLNFQGATPRRLHRDTLQWSRAMITVIVYLEDSMTVNGCTEIVPGSQFLPFVGVPNNGGTWMDEHEIFEGLNSQAVPLPMSAGGLLFIDSACFHTVGVNQTSGTRASITLGFHSVDELSKEVDNSDRVLVRGTRIYKGNDL